MRIDIVTLFPGMVEPVLGASMLGRARARGLVDIRVLDLRDYAKGKHRIADDYQFGGGGGMVLKREPLFQRDGQFNERAYANARANNPQQFRAALDQIRVGAVTDSAGTIHRWGDQG